MAQSQDTVTAIMNWRPCIGVLCIDIATKLQTEYGMDIRSYIAASYVKFVESAGAWVVPIWIGRDRSYYENIMSQVNGILIPGGEVYLKAEQATEKFPNYCVESVRLILEIASARNDAGHYFPLWGTCLGMQLLLVHSARDVEVRRPCEPMHCLLPLKLEPDLEESRMFSKLDDELRDMLQRKSVVYHSHRYCVTKEKLQQYQIQGDWRALASSKDSAGLEFVSIVEHVKYPFYGVMFHQERACFEHLNTVELSDDRGLRHAIKTSQYFANFFVAECRKSDNRFVTYAEQLRHLIELFPVTFTAHVCPRWLQCYLFKSAPDYPASVGAGTNCLL